MERTERFAENAGKVAAEIAAVLPRIDAREVRGLVEAVIAARQVQVIGVGREGLSARGFTMRLMHTGIDSHWVWDDTTPAIGEGDLLIAVSGSGEIGHIDYVVRQAAARGARVAVVTANPDGATARVADLVLAVPAAAFHAGDDVVPSIQPMGSLFEQTLLIALDLVILEIAADLGRSPSELAARHRNVE